MVETRMDAMISRIAPQPPPAGPRPARQVRQAREQVLKARPAEDKGSVEADVARIFAKRAFQATPMAETLPAAQPKDNPRGGNLDILA